MIEAVSKEEAQRADFLVSMRVADLPPPPETDKSPWADFQRTVMGRSTIEPCSGCGEDCYRDSKAPTTPKLICMPCAHDIAAQATAKGPTQ